ncbi:hypothetical protein SmJEL517_g04570 [Synchytrium microbalum]|uniref:Ubiquinone biosynthesis O-methyltransferase, mitochondrial n=1 Tax=Synchytrium microbalum TaxID=1806994 RepID=A0A507C438_9FUNG|nr:uncharacterized protein SmJEL517_g04570 [Synchytrium microbalum]TPX32283.1 hypothetical protein SmJEL517_g04570 [Synchytrium microbalum]
MRSITLARTISRAYTSSTTASPSNTIRPDEINRFSNEAQHWWNPYGPYRLLHKMNPVRTSYIRDWTRKNTMNDASSSYNHIHQALHSKSILDVGCGGGLLSEGLARLGANVTGIDADPVGVRVAEMHGREDPLVRANVKYINTTAEQLAETHASTFDVVCALEIIEHVSDRHLFLQSCAQLLKPNGLLFVSTINRTPISYFLTILMAEQVLKLVSAGTHTHEQYVTPQELESEISRVSCRVVDVSGLLFDPLGQEWRLADSGVVREIALQANYITCAIKNE